MLTPPSAPPDSTRATGAPPPAASQPQRPAPFWQARHPLWLCAFRPFFALTMLGSVGLVALWLLFLGAGWPLPAVPGGAVVWHVHELLLGVTLAAVTGFALTAVPEFTRTPAFAVRPVRQLAGWWLLGRLAFWLSGWWPTPALAVAGLAHLAFMLQLSALLLPRLWHDPGRRQLGFGWAMLALLVTIAGFHVDVLRDEYPMRWLHATLGVLMALIVVAMSRISMAIVNDAIDAQPAPEPHRHWRPSTGPPKPSSARRDALGRKEHAGMSFSSPDIVPLERTVRARTRPQRPAGGPCDGFGGTRQEETRDRVTTSRIICCRNDNVYRSSAHSVR